MPNHQKLDPLRFWQNLVCLDCLWCLSLMPIFSSIYHIVSDLWPQIFYFIKNWSDMSYKINHNSSLCYYYNNNCYSGIIKANCNLLHLVLTQIHSPYYKTYIELKLKLSNKCLKLLVEVASAIPPGKLFQLLITRPLNECLLRSVVDRYLNNLNWWPLVRWLLGVKVNKTEILNVVE